MVEFFNKIATMRTRSPVTVEAALNRALGITAAVVKLASLGNAEIIGPHGRATIPLSLLLSGLPQ